MAKKKSKKNRDALKNLNVSRKTLSIAILVAVIVVSMGSLYYINHLGNQALDPTGTPETSIYTTEEDEQIKVVSYVRGDPLIILRRMFTEDEVNNIYLLFSALPGEAPENSYLVRGAAAISEGVGMTKGNIIHARELSPWHKYMMGINMIGSKTRPVIYMKTPNLDGMENRLVILNEGVLIVESKNFQDTVLLSDFLRTAILGRF